MSLSFTLTDIRKSNNLLKDLKQYIKLNFKVLAEQIKSIYSSIGGLTFDLMTKQFAFIVRPCNILKWLPHIIINGKLYTENQTNWLKSKGKLPLRTTYNEKKLNIDKYYYCTQEQFNEGIINLSKTLEIKLPSLDAKSNETFFLLCEEHGISSMVIKLVVDAIAMINNIAPKIIKELLTAVINNPDLEIYPEGINNSIYSTLVLMITVKVEQVLYKFMKGSVKFKECHELMLNYKDKDSEFIETVMTSDYSDIWFKSPSSIRTLILMISRVDISKGMFALKEMCQLIDLIEELVDSIDQPSVDNLVVNCLYLGKIAKLIPDKSSLDHLMQELDRKRSLRAFDSVINKEINQSKKLTNNDRLKMN